MPRKYVQRRIHQRPEEHVHSRKRTEKNRSINSIAERLFIYLLLINKY